MPKRIVGIEYEDGIVKRIGIDGIVDDVTVNSDVVYFKRVKPIGYDDEYIQGIKDFREAFGKDIAADNKDIDGTCYYKVNDIDLDNLVKKLKKDWENESI